MIIDTKELRRLAQAATPGPWKVGQYLGSPRQFVIHMDVGDKGRGSDVAFTSANFGNDETIANARLIAAANPAAISELLDRLEATEEDRSNFLVEMGKLCAQCDALCLRIEAAEKERDALRDRIEVTDEVVRELEKKLSTGMWRALREEKEALRTKIAEMESQKPVAWARKLGMDLPSFGCVTDLKYRPSDMPESAYMPLYALPGAQGEER